MPNVFMITLQAGGAPPVLKRLPAPDLEHLSVFSSRSREDGRDRYRLHVGYFDEEAPAQALLGRVRAWYPEAWVVAAGRYTVIARLPALVPASGVAVEGAVVSALPPSETLLSQDPSVSAPLEAPEPQVTEAGLDPMLRAQPPLETALTLAPILQAADVLHTYKGDTAAPRASLSVSDWTVSASTQKPKSKPRPTSWFKRLTVLQP